MRHSTKRGLFSSIEFSLRRLLSTNPVFPFVFCYHDTHWRISSPTTHIQQQSLTSKVKHKISPLSLSQSSHVPSKSTLLTTVFFKNSSFLFEEEPQFSCYHDFWQEMKVASHRRKSSHETDTKVLIMSFECQEFDCCLQSSIIIIKNF